MPSVCISNIFYYSNVILCCVSRLVDVFLLVYLCIDGCIPCDLVSGKNNVHAFFQEPVGLCIKLFVCPSLDHCSFSNSA